MKTRHSLAERLANKPALLGFMQTNPNPAVAELAGMCGYDFLIMDGEHGLFSEMDQLRTLHALGSSDTAVLARLRGHDTQALGRYLDLGVDGIVVPNVTTAEQAKTLVRAMDYPPVGTRNFAASVHRGTRYGMDLAAHLRAPREAVWLSIMIESALGVANVEDILAVEGVDAVVIGPTDLTADLGYLRDFSQPGYDQALACIERAAAERGKIVGSAPHLGFPLGALLARGHRLLIVSDDMLLIRDAMISHLENARSCLKATGTDGRKA